ncbi:MAG: diaminopimelate decarboxylase [Oscillospiraceae bacterium]|nr:diaminopimelate decarboxylase [Oscillospiraceae bacterium]
MICDNLKVNEQGHLLFAERDTTLLAQKYGTPLYVMDESRIRYNIRQYVNAMKEAFGEKFLLLYASKACSFKEMYRIANDENIGVDVVSEGEIYTAKAAGFPMHRAHFHGNNKTDREISLAMDASVGYFVVDHADELVAISKEAQRRSITQKILLRITPGIDTHTFEAVMTGQVDSKFGSAIETGHAQEITRLALSLEGISLEGFHCHVGSQVFDSDTFFMSADIMLSFIADIREKFGYTAKELDLGGGYGVRYLDSDPYIDIADNIRQVAEHIKAACKRLSLPVPTILLEPGRSIVADAGMTLYTVGSIKRLDGYKNYVSVDGGMSDNPRFALYGAPYTVVLPEKMHESCDFECSVVGKCCESGDILQENVKLPQSVKRGDLLAVLTTGAYNYSMASNYNRNPRPPVVMLSEQSERVVVRRESLEDIIRNDL